MEFTGFSFAGYRSIGNELVKISPLSKINLIVGQNNTGKSNIINFLHRHYESIVDEIIKSSTTHFENKFDLELDKHQPDKNIEPKVAFSLDLTGDEIKNLFNGHRGKEVSARSISLIKTILTTPEFHHENGVSLMVYSANDLNGKYEVDVDIDKLEGILSNHDWQFLWHELTSQSSGSLRQHWLPETIREILLVHKKSISRPPKVEVIPAKREIETIGEKLSFLNNTSLTEELAKLQNPAFSNQHLKKKFEKINTFLKNVLEKDEAMIEIPFERDGIMVHLNDKVLPLSSLGTGIHEVVILACAATLLDDTILCIEEPEIHIHPLLQKKLVEYLTSSTSNQYIIATHSAHILDTVGAEVFHVNLVNGITEVSSAVTSKRRINICHDLGYKASDLLQSNSIIWVEGPSDRIYINFWMKNYDSSLVEGIHYSIMFFGGKSFSHLTGEEDESVEVGNVSDLIAVRKLNRYSSIIFDSDKKSARSGISDTKTRLEKEFNKGPGFTWITSCKEIENYIDPDAIEECVLNVHKSAKSIVNKDRWKNPLLYKKKSSTKIISANKVKVARYYVENYEADLTVLDLGAYIQSLNEFIRKANGI